MSRALILVTSLLSLDVTAEGSQSRFIDEIIVTAQKVEEEAQETSLPITVFNGERIRDFGLSDPEDLAVHIPSFSRTEYDFTIRGVGRNFRGLGGDPGVGTYTNGMYVEDAFLSGTESNLYDVDRIEVLRGPQGTLYGRNSIGGVVNYITKPPTSNFEAEVVVGAGDHSLEEYYGYVSGPLIDNVLNGRLTGTKRRQAGDRKSRAVPGAVPISDTGGSNDHNIVLSLDYTPAENFSVFLRANNRESDGVRRAELHIGEGQGDRSVRSDAVCFPETVQCYVQSAGEAGFLPSQNSSANRTIPISGDGFGEDLDNEAWPDYKPAQSIDHSSVSIDAQWVFGYGQYTLRYLGGYSEFHYHQDAPWSAPGGRNYCEPPFCTPGPNSVQFREDHFEVDQKNRNYSHELQLISDLDGRVNFVAGVFSYFSDVSQELRWRDTALFGALTRTPSYGLIGNIFGDPVYPVRHDIDDGGARFGSFDALQDGSYLWTFSDLETTAYAVYSQIKFELVENLRLNIGGRWSYDEKDFSDRSWTMAEIDIGIPLDQLNVLMTTDPTTGESNGDPYRIQGYPVSVQFGYDNDEAWREPIWRVALDWFPSENTLFYGSISTGYRSGGFIGILGQDFSYDAEAITAYELGAKSDLLDGRARINGAVYLYQYDDQQSQTVAPLPCPTPGCLQSQPVSERIINVPDAEALGAELEATISVTPELTVGGHYSYLDTEVTSDLFLSKLGNDLADDIGADVLQNAKGFRLVRAPENKFTLWANYALSLGNRGRIDFFTSFAHTGDQYQDIFNVRINRMPSFQRWDARISWQDPRGRYQVSAWINNIENELGITSIETAPNTGRRATTTAPRIWGLEFKTRFGVKGT